MWRSLFAVAHADNFLALEEQGMLSSYLDTVPFSPAQLSVLREDMATPQNIEQMFGKITKQEDRDAFFELARKLVWCDGDLEVREQALLQRLEALKNDGEAPLENGCCFKGFFRNMLCKIAGKGN